MPALSGVQLVTGGALTSITGNFVVTLPENCLVFIDIVNFHSTAASLSLIDISHSGGKTFVNLGTRTVGTTPNRRITRFVCMSEGEDLSGTITVTALNGIAQSNIDWTVTAIGGVDTSGVNGGAAYGATTPYDSGNAAVTSVPGGLALTPPSSLQYGFFATWVSAVGATAITPRFGWTELGDHQVGTSANRVETQFIGTSDTFANATVGSGLLMGFVTEVRSIVNPVVVEIGAHTFFNNFNMSSPFVLSFAVRKDTTYYVMTGRADTATPLVMTLTIAGVVVALLFEETFEASFGTRTRFYAFRATADVTLSLVFTAQNSPATLNWFYRIATISNLDTSIGSGVTTGVVQSATHAVTTGQTHAFDLNVPPSPNHALLILGVDNAVGGTAPAPAIGWQGNQGVLASSLCSPAVMWRTNAEETPTFVTQSGSGKAYGIVLELQQAPAIGPAPVIALVSPAEGVISSTDPIVVDVTSSTGALDYFSPTLVLGTAGIVELMHDWDGGAFTPAYLVASTRVALPGLGFRYTFERSSGWPDTTITLVGVAIDLFGQKTIEDFAFTVPSSAGLGFGGGTSNYMTTKKLFMVQALRTAAGFRGLKAKMRK